MTVQHSQAVIFPGQGSQQLGMGRDLAEYDSEVMDLWKRAEKICRASLREIYWDGDSKAMTETRYQQPALLVVELGLWLHCCSWLKPAYLAGHSVGEYSALAAGEVLSFHEVLDLVALRGRLMAEAGEQQAGSMAASLKLTQPDVEEIVNEIREQSGQELCIANYNSPVQLVISGQSAAVDLAMKKIKARKGRAVSLPVSGAFHSSLMHEAAQELARFMDKLDWRAPKIPVHMNVTGRPETSAEGIRATLQKQMISPVCWFQLMRDQWERGVRRWFELGPKGVLTGLAKYILPDDKDWQAELLSSLEELKNLQEALAEDE